MNVTKGGKALTEVGQNQDKISIATEDVFIHLDQFASSFKHLLGTFVEAFLHFCAPFLRLNFKDMSPQKSVYHVTCSFPNMVRKIP